MEVRIPHIQVLAGVCSFWEGIYFLVLCSFLSPGIPWLVVPSSIFKVSSKTSLNLWFGPSCLLKDPGQSPHLQIFNLIPYASSLCHMLPVWYTHRFWGLGLGHLWGCIIKPPTSPKNPCGSVIWRLRWRLWSWTDLGANLLCHSLCNLAMSRLHSLSVSQCTYRWKGNNSNTNLVGLL